MRHPVALLLTVCLLFAAFIGCVGCTVAPTQPETPAPNMPPAPPDKPAPLPAVKVHLLLFTQPGCAPCLALKLMLKDPALADVMVHFELEEVRYPDRRFREYKVNGTPTLIALTAAGPKKYPVGGTLGQLGNWLDDVLPKDTPAPAPHPHPAPPPAPAPHPAPHHPHKEMDGVGGPRRPRGDIIEGGPVGPGGAEVATDLPVELRHKNVGGRDGAGCCPFASTQHSARYSNERRLWNFLTDVSKNERGGGWPAKMDLMMKKYGHGAPYLQYEGRDTSVLELALNTGRMPAVTYSGRDCHYRGGIAHMVSLVYLSKEKNQACILDNNFIGANQLVWMSYADFVDRWCGHGSGWAVFLLAPRPPAPPRSAK